MALNNNGMREREFIPTVYSRVTFNNKDSEVDKTRLEFSYWSGMLKVTISPFIAGSDEVDRKANISLHLTATKAYEFLKEIEQFEEDEKNEVNTNFFYGVNTPKGLIGIGKGDDYGHPGSVLLTIRRMDENGDTISSYAYELKQNGYYYGIRNFNPSLKTYERSYHNNLELDMIKKHLSNFVDSMVMAEGYSSMDALRYYTESIYKSLNQIKAKLGIKIESKTYGTGNFFRNDNDGAPPKTSYTSITEAINPENEEVEEELDVQF